MRIDPDFIARHFDWERWQTLIEAHGVVIERPRGSRHPQFQEIIYPIDYGYVPGTDGGDGGEVDVFAGTARRGLVGLILTTDHRRGDREAKLLWHCTPKEIYLVNGFINFDRRLMEGVLILRRPMHEFWEKQSG